MLCLQLNVPLTFRRGQWLVGVRLHGEVQEVLEVGDEEETEVVRAGEELGGGLEGGEADLSVLLGQLGHQQVVDMLNVVIGGLADLLELFHLVLV